MNENVENLVVEHLRAMRAQMGKMEQVLEEVNLRMTRMEAGFNLLRRDNTLLHETDAGLHARMDRMERDVARIERRLELADAD